MKNKIAILAMAVLVMAMVVSTPVAQAQIVTYLPSIVWDAIVAAGKYIAVSAIGAAVIAGAYVVWHKAVNSYSYFTAYGYTTVQDYAYKHAAEFPNIWGSGVIPPKADFNKKCKDNMNSKTALKYIQKADGRLLSYNPTTMMLSIGEPDGKTVMNCFPKPYADVLKKVSTGEWIKVK
jgi:hypothetical protein